MTPTEKPALPELLPCPFCGGAVAVSFAGSFAVRCPNVDCEAAGPLVDSIEWETGFTLAIAAWNTRAAHPRRKGE